MLAGNSHRRSSHSKNTKNTKTSVRKKRQLIKPQDRIDIEKFLQRYGEITEHYIPVAIIGEGTFSTVYKAIDVTYYDKDNSMWEDSSRQDPSDPSRLYSLFKSINHSVNTRARKKTANSRLNKAIKEFIMEKYGGGKDCLGISNLVIKQRMKKKPPMFVAVKRINATSGPKRIVEELNYIKKLGGEHHVIPLIAAEKYSDQCVIVSPYFHGIDFRELLPKITIKDVAGYLRLLLESLAHVHEKYIIHRDIKPSNFLFSQEKNGTFRGMLVDFGLAQVQEQDMRRKHKTIGRKAEIISCPQTLKGFTFSSKLRGLPPGYIKGDPRHQIKASRAGTRGFRAPEVLFKVAHQTIAIDIWSVGVIMLTMLTRRYPFFQSTDDFDALAELATIFGHEEMQKCAILYDRQWSCNIPTIPKHRIPWSHLVSCLNPHWEEKIPPEAFHLLNRLLDYNYKTRITALEALEHPFLVKY